MKLQSIVKSRTVKLQIKNCGYEVLPFSHTIVLKCR